MSVGGTAVSAPRNGLIALLVALSAFGPLSMSIYTPAMPAIGVSLHASDEEVKLTLTTFLLGFAAGQLFAGPLSDRFGRRPMLLIGVSIYVVMSLACALADEIGLFILLRLFHGIGAAAGSVIARAIARDVFGHGGAARVMAMIALGINAAPAVAPVVGGHVTMWFGWEAVFYVLAGFGMMIVALVSLRLEETAPPDPQASIGRTLSQIPPMLAHGRFMGFVLAVGAIFGAMFAYVAGIPFVLMDMVGMTPGAYGYWILFSVAGFSLGSFIAGRLVGRVTPERAILQGLLVSLLGALMMLGLALAGILDAPSVVGPYTIVSVGCGMVMPNALSAGVNLFPRQAGTASSLLGTLQMGSAGVATVFVSAASDGTQMPMIWVLTGFVVFGLAVWFLLLRKPPAPGEPGAP